ncbi:unnamed protein product [Caenorhabditis nigoni]
MIHTASRVKQVDNNPKLTKTERLKFLKAELILLLVCLILQHFIVSKYCRHFPEYYSDDPYYWPMTYFMFALGLCSIILTFFMAEHSISLFHPSDFLGIYEIIICFIYLLIIADLGRNLTERLYCVFYYHIIKGILIVFLDPSGIVDTFNKSEMMIIRTWTGRKYRGHPASSPMSMVFFEFDNVEECVEGKMWEKLKYPDKSFLGVQIMWIKRWRPNPEVFGIA